MQEHKCLGSMSLLLCLCLSISLSLLLSLLSSSYTCNPAYRPRCVQHATPSTPSTCTTPTFLVRGPVPSRLIFSKVTSVAMTRALSCRLSWETHVLLGLVLPCLHFSPFLYHHHHHQELTLESNAKSKKNIINFHFFCNFENLRLIRPGSFMQFFCFISI